MPSIFQARRPVQPNVCVGRMAVDWTCGGVAAGTGTKLGERSADCRGAAGIDRTHPATEDKGIGFWIILPWPPNGRTRGIAEAALSQSPSVGSAFGPGD